MGRGRGPSHHRMFKLDGSAPGGNADTRRKYGHQVEMRIPDGSADAGEMRIPDGSAPGGNADTGRKSRYEAAQRRGEQKR